MRSPPIIIIGAPRSGTKILRDCLAAADGADAVPFDINHVWRVGQWSAPDDRLDPDALTPSEGRYIRRRIQRLAGPGTPVEKTVSNAVRVPFVDAVLPEAQFVHLVRDGRDVMESILRQWDAPVEAGYIVRKARTLGLRGIPYGVWYAANLFRRLGRGRRGVHYWGVRHPGWKEDIERRSLVEVVARQWAACRRMATDDLAKLGKDRYVTLEYEDLVAGKLEPVLEFLELPVEGPMHFHHERIQAGFGGRWRELPDAQRRVVEMAAENLEKEATP